jgi:hypothetical protein
VKGKFNKLATVTSLLLATTVYRAGAADMIRVGTTESPHGLINFMVPRDRLYEETNAWNRARGEFPVDLKLYAEKAKQHLTASRRVSEPISLCGVSMRQYRSREPYRSKTGELKIGGWVERWILDFQFKRSAKSWDTEKPLTVVMLLDGTIAEEQPSIK